MEGFEVYLLLEPSSKITVCLSNGEGSYRDEDSGSMKRLDGDYESSVPQSHRGRIVL
jgi:hypothetical protein